MNQEIFRTVHRAELKSDSQSTETLVQSVQHLNDKITNGDLLTLSLFRWHTTLFLYAEGITTPFSPDEHLTDIHLQPWPGGTAGPRHWVPMMDIFHFSRPQNAAHWRRKSPVETPFARVIRLRPDMVSSYIFYHYQLQEERPGKGDKYGIITLHEDLLFFYQERPRITEEAPSAPTLQTQNTPSNWQELMTLHFALWNDPGDPQWRLIDYLTSIGLPLQK